MDNSWKFIFKKEIEEAEAQKCNKPARYNEALDQIAAYMQQRVNNYAEENGIHATFSIVRHAMLEGDDPTKATLLRPMVEISATFIKPALFKKLEKTQPILPRDMHVALRKTFAAKYDGYKPAEMHIMCAADQRVFIADDTLVTLAKSYEFQRHNLNSFAKNLLNSLGVQKEAGRKIG